MIIKKMIGIFFNSSYLHILRHIKNHRSDNKQQNKSPQSKQQRAQDCAPKFSPNIADRYHPFRTDHPFQLRDTSGRNKRKPPRFGLAQ